MPRNMQNLEEIRQYLIQFAQERDWQQFQSPKSLSMALSVEVAEVVEHFQWATLEESDQLSPEQTDAVAEEIADVQMYLILLADRLGIDIIQSVNNKTVKNELKYPKEKSKGKVNRPR